MRLDPAGIGWQVINDGVMGGLSRSAWRADAGGLHFHGTLSTANAGGFASVRGALAAPLSGIDRLVVDVTGDGRRYQLRLRESSEPDAVAWRAFFDTTGARESIELAAGAFEPVIRGRRVAVDGGLAQRTFHHIGFMLTSQQEGPFALSVHQIDIPDSQGRHD
jgi:monofunctional biosynthetic peptidoglycan transglycosylase